MRGARVRTQIIQDVSRYFTFHRKAAVNARGACTYTDYTDVSRYFNFHRKAAVNARGTCIDIYVWICAGTFLYTERLPLMRRARARTKIYMCVDMHRDCPLLGKAC
jgi:hypothetical protein